MIQKLWLYPPLAFGRLGPSETPCDSFYWGSNDLRPRGTGKTTIQPAETLHVSADGTVTSSMPTEIKFKDAAGFKPVCPFFELHGEWVTEEGTVRGPITPQVLAELGLTAHDLKWKVEVANLKPFHYTLVPSDRIAATIELTGDVTEQQMLLGVSLPNAEQPLVPVGKHLLLGSIQLTKPTEQFPEFRLRFTPAAGRMYGPTNLAERSSEFVLPPDRLILNAEAAWCRFVPVGDDFRTNPGGLYATDENGVSLGLVDDVCDGMISCSLNGVSPAFARVVVGPPTYAPDRRPFTSLADGLTDRVRRHDVRDPAYVEDMEMTTLEVRDLMERIFETVELTNIDAQNDRARGENRTIAIEQGLPPNAAEDKAFPRMEPVLGRPLPLTEVGRQRHRRFVPLEVFEDILRERPDLVEKIIREPTTGDRYYDQRMPAVIRGSDRHPMHITRRQYDLLMAWVRRLRRDVEGGT
jgi:hypothetical protein